MPTGDPDVVLWVRNTLAWEDVAAVERDMKERFRAFYELWNATFEQSYPRFRQRVTAIAAANWRAVRSVAVAELDQIPDGALVVPTDDDDWFAPDLAERLRDMFDPERPCYLWRHTTVELPRSIREELALWLWRARGGRSRTCSTNNYAVVMGAARREAFGSHGVASRFYDAHPEWVRRSGARLNVQNRNVSSRSIGKHGPPLARADLITRLERYRRFYARVRLPRELAWAEPALCEMASLTARLEVR